MEPELTSVSVVIATHHHDTQTEIETAIKSLVDQTVPPTEIITIYDADAPPTFERFLSSLANTHNTVRLLEQPASDGRGAARARGIEAADNPYVAIMDADDISLSDRFETQSQYLDKHPEVDVIGGYLAEFSDDPEKIDTVREVPLDHEAIRSKARFRCPLNHQTVMARRRAVLAAGNYHDIAYGEDWDLWVRMLTDGATFTNLQTVLTKARAGSNLYQRRGGVEIARGDIYLQRQFVKYGFQSLLLAVVNLVVRVPIRLLPNNIRQRLYEHLWRT